MTGHGRDVVNSGATDQVGGLDRIVTVFEVFAAMVPSEQVMTALLVGRRDEHQTGRQRIADRHLGRSVGTLVGDLQGVVELVV